MVLPIGGKVLLDTNVFIDFLRADRHTEWILGGHGTVVRFISLSFYLNSDSVQTRQNARKPLTDFNTHSLPNALSA